MRKLICFICFFQTILLSSIKQELLVYSSSMNKNIPVTVILPNDYSESKKYSTIYFLHGFNGNNVKTVKKEELDKVIDDYNNLIFVIPDGNTDGKISWYIDSKVSRDSKFETFISKELVSYIDNNYSTINSRENRAIMGYSAGGYGSLYIGIRNSEVFKNIGSMSAVIYPQNTHSRLFEKIFRLDKIFENDFKNEYNIIEIIPILLDKNVNLYITCGKDDELIDYNRKLNNVLNELGINHIYEESIGRHNHSYWNPTTKKLIKYFNQVFEKGE